MMPTHNLAGAGVASLLIVLFFSLTPLALAAGKKTALEIKFEKEFDASSLPDSYKKCRRGWKKRRKVFRQSLAKWKNPKCYEFVFVRICECLPKYSGPFKVTVNDRKVQKVEYIGEGETFSDEDMARGGNRAEVPTMNEMYQEVYENCIAGCPVNKGAPFCGVSYEKGHITAVSIDIMKDVIDEEIIYYVADFKLCG